MAKERIRVEIRTDANFKKYLEEASAFHGCTMTDFVITQCLNQEYIEVNWKDIDELIRLFSNLANNINQIARILNSARKNSDFLTDEQLEAIQIKFDNAIKLFDEHRAGADKNIDALYQLTREQKTRVSKYETDIQITEETEN